MITDAEFVMAKAFDKTLFDSVDHSQRIIDAKNWRVNSADACMVAQARQIEALTLALTAERAKNASLMRQVRGLLK